MVFVDGFFHADPHPGNLFVLPGGALGLIDFGMVGELTESQRDRLADLFIAVVSGEPSPVAVALIRLSTRPGVDDFAALVSDIATTLASLHGLRLGEVSMGNLLLQLVSMMRHHGLILQPSLAALIRMLVMIEGLGVRLDPTFVLSDALRPRATALAAARLSPGSLLGRLKHAGIDTAELGLAAPGRLRDLLDRIDVDGILVQLRAAELEPLVGRLEKIGNRLVAGLIAASFITGIAEMTSRGAAGRRLLRVGYLVAGGLTAYLVGTARSKR
jgi:ubiquinone biosynthesis protein